MEELIIYSYCKSVIMSQHSAWIHLFPLPVSPTAELLFAFIYQWSHSLCPLVPGITQYVRVTIRNCTLVHIRCFEKMADEAGATKNHLYWFTSGLSDFFWEENFVIFIISSITTKKDESKCPLLPILAGSLECIKWATMSSTESSICSSPEAMDLGSGEQLGRQEPQEEATCL